MTESNFQAAPPMQSLSWMSQAGRLARLTRKEVLGVLRDRRTIITLIFMPILLYPLLAVGFRQFLLSRKIEEIGPLYRIGFRNPDEQKSISGYLDVGQEVLKARVKPTPEQPTRDQTPPRIHVEIAENLDDAVLQGTIDIGFKPKQPGSFEVRPREELDLEWEVLYRPDSTFGRDAVRHVERLCEAANVRFLMVRLAALGIRQRDTPVRIIPHEIHDPDASKPLTLAIIIPLVLILMTITGGVYPAIDLTAGERERGTLEILMAAPVPRLGLLLAKYFAVVTVAVLTAVVNLGTMAITLFASNLGPVIFAGGGLTVLMFLKVFGLLLLFAAFFSAVLLALTSFTRSFKEAQAALVPLMLLAMAPGMLSLVPGVSLEGPLVVVPLINIVLLARDVFQGGASSWAALIVIVTTLLYALAALTAAARFFGAEAVLFNEQGNWSDLVRRPAKSRQTPTLASAMACLTLMFPVYFVITGFSARLANLGLLERLAIMTLANILLFGGFAFVAAWLGRVEIKAGFRLGLPAWPALAGALVLGLCLWPFAHELGLGLRSLGISTLSPEQLEKVKEVLVEWRNLSPLILVLALGVIPPVLEELVFRGYLLSALLGVTRPRNAVLGSAILFGLFHLIVTDSLAVERFLPSTLLGLVLAWLTWQAGSVLPAMLMHVVHNSLLVLLGYYQPQLAERGWTFESDDHVPGVLLAVAGGGAILAFAWLGLTRKLGTPGSSPALPSTLQD